MAEGTEADEKKNVVPGQDPQCDESADKKDQLRDAPERFLFVLAHESLENRNGIFPKEAQERVAERMFRLAVIAMFVNRDPIDRLAFFVRPVRVPLVVLHVDAVVKDLAKPDADRFENAEQPVQNRQPEIRVM